MVDSPENQQSLINVHEPPVGIGSGFLTDYWQSREALPRIRGLEVVWYYLARGVQTLIALPMNSAITVLTIAVSLFLLAGFLLMLQNVGGVLADVGNALHLTVYFKEEADDKDVSNFIRRLEGNNQVRSVVYVGKDEALKIFREDLGEKAGILEGLEKDNPLPASVDVVLRPNTLGASGVEDVVKKLRSVKVVDDVVFGGEWVDRMKAVLQVFNAFGMVSILVAMCVIVFLISNTIKLVIYSRRDEISIMQLVGASDNFVRIPFVLGGLFQGFVGSMIGLSLLKGCFLLLDYQIKNSKFFGIALPEIVFLNIPAAVGVVLFGVVVGAVGSFFALRKFMNV